MYKQYLTITIQATRAAFVKHTLHAARFMLLNITTVNNGKLCMPIRSG